MDSASTLSPPTSCARAARSLVAVMIWTFPAARAGSGPIRARTSISVLRSAVTRAVKRGANILSPAGVTNGLPSSKKTSKRVSAVRAHYEQKLEEKFIRIREISRIGKSEMSEAVLATDLAELAGPIGKNTGKAGVGQIGVVGVAAAIEAAADSPATVDAILGGGVGAEGVLGLEGVERGDLVAGAPEEFGAEQE